MLIWGAEILKLICVYDDGQYISLSKSLEKKMKFVIIILYVWFQIFKKLDLKNINKIKYCDFLTKKLHYFILLLEWIVWNN